MRERRSRKLVIYPKKKRRKKKEREKGSNSSRTVGRDHRLFPLKNPQAVTTERGESKKKEGEIPPTPVSFRVPSTTSSFINRASINIRQNSSRDAWHPIEVMAVGLQRDSTTELLYMYVRTFTSLLPPTHVFRVYICVYTMDDRTDGSRELSRDALAIVAHSSVRDQSCRDYDSNDRVRLLFNVRLEFVLSIRISAYYIYIYALHRNIFSNSLFSPLFLFV